MEREVGQRTATARDVAGWVERREGAWWQGTTMSAAVRAPAAWKKRIHLIAADVDGTLMALILSPRASEEREGKGEAVSMGAVAKNTLENAFEHINRPLV